MNSLERIFNEKLTENGDISYKSTGNDMLDLLFMSNYYEKHLEEVEYKAEYGEKWRLFAMFIRDCRLGLGRRELGRQLMYLTDVKPENVPKCGRYDDLLYMGVGNEDYLEQLVNDGLGKGIYLAKKWLPRLNSVNGDKAKYICRSYGISEKEYRRRIKLDTTENLLSRHRTNEIDFEHVPSLAMLKYYRRFATGEDTKERFLKYLQEVKKGEKKLNISTTTVYDIYKNRQTIDADLFFDKLEKISINCIPILDTSGSMWDNNDSIGKAVSIAHYLAKCSSYCNGYVISFSSNPKLIKIEERKKVNSFYNEECFGNKNKYSRELNSLYTGDCSNTDFGKVMTLLERLEDMPEYLVVLSDMEFDCGSKQSKDKLEKLWKEKGYTTKIVWWNFNDRHTTVPEIDEMGNIFISGYNPMLLKYLEAGFNGELFLDKLLEEYKKNLTKEYKNIII